jgi:hypothetical protein
MVVILNTWFTEDKSPCNDLSFCMLISRILIEIKMLLIDQILHHFVLSCNCYLYSWLDSYWVWCQKLTKQGVGLRTWIIWLRIWIGGRLLWRQLLICRIWDAHSICYEYLPSTKVKFSLPPTSYWILVWFILYYWWWRLLVLLKPRLSFNGIHGVIIQNR